MREEIYFFSLYIRVFTASGCFFYTKADDYEPNRSKQTIIYADRAVPDRMVNNAENTVIYGEKTPIKAEPADNTAVLKG